MGAEQKRRPESVNAPAHPSSDPLDSGGDDGDSAAAGLILDS
jgi:hypothetical protein